MKITSRRWWLASIAAVAVAVSAVLATVASAGAGATSSQPGGLGQSSGLLPRNHLTLESAIQVNLSKETVRLPLYPGTAYTGTPHAEKVWYVLLDASDSGLAHDLGVNYAPKLANIAIGDPAAVQTVTLTNPTPQDNPFGPAVVNFAGAPDFSPTRIATPGTERVPAGQVRPRCRGRPGYSPFIRFAGSGRRLQRADRGHRQRAVRRGPPHQHRGPRPGHPHRGPVQARPVRRVVGGHAVRQGLRRRAADPVPVHRRRPAADRGAGALHLRARAEQRRLQRRRRLPRLGPRAAVRVHQRPDRRHQPERAGVRAPDQGRLRRRRRLRRATPR